MKLESAAFITVMCIKF